MCFTFLDTYRTDSSSRDKVARACHQKTVNLDSAREECAVLDVLDAFEKVPDLDASCPEADHQPEVHRSAADHTCPSDDDSDEPATIKCIYYSILIFNA